MNSMLLNIFCDSSPLLGVGLLLWNELTLVTSALGKAESNRAMWPQREHYTPF